MSVRKPSGVWRRHSGICGVMLTVRTGRTLGDIQPTCQRHRIANSVCFSLCRSVTLHRTVVSKYAHTHTQLLNGPLSMTTQVSWYQKGKTNLDFTEARDCEWQWHQLGHMQVCTSLQQTTTPAPHHSVFYRPDALPAAQPTASKH